MPVEERLHHWREGGLTHGELPQSASTLSNLHEQRTNGRVVTLIQEKLLPLNRSRYEHLQKIHQALRKDTFVGPACRLNQALCPPSHPRSSKRKGLTTRPNQLHNAETDLLLTRLRSLKMDSKWAEAHDCSLPEAESTTSSWRSSTFEDKVKSRRGKEPLLELVRRAESHLRTKKRQLRERFTDKIGGRRAINGTSVEMRGLGGRGDNEEQLQREMLRDIRLNMQQEKMNRLKRDINHKKIVQLR